MIYILNPAEKLPAHITLKGPFVSEASASHHRGDVAGAIVSIVGAGRFSPPQLTVFLQCDASAIKANWWKPNHGYHPHITLYDGDSSELSEGAFTILHSLRLFATVTLGKTVVYPSHSGQGTMLLSLNVDHDRLSSLAGRRLTAAQVMRLSIPDRLDCVRLLALELKSSLA